MIIHRFLFKDITFLLFNRNFGPTIFELNVSTKLVFRWAKVIGQVTLCFIMSIQSSAFHQVRIYSEIRRRDGEFCDVNVGPRGWYMFGFKPTNVSFKPHMTTYSNFQPTRGKPVEKTARPWRSSPRRRNALIREPPGAKRKDLGWSGPASEVVGTN